jgi:hypothetical protein
MKLFTDVKRKAAAFERLIDRHVAALAHARRRARHPLEIHHAILEEVEAQVTAGPGGSHLFPYDHVTLDMLATDDGRAEALEAMFVRGGGFQEEIGKRLAQRDCEIPADLTCTMRRVTVKPVEWPVEAIYRLGFRRSTQNDALKKRLQPADLTFTLPSGERGPVYRLADTRITVGRTAEVRDRHGRLLRRNTICISDEHDPDATVSRCHAHLDALYREGVAVCYTLYDDASRYGTRVVRGGTTIVVHPGTVGVRLRDGDELCFGAARATLQTTTA